MATIKTGSPSWYYDGISGASEVVGWESRRTRVARHQFKTTSIGASFVSWTFEGISDEPVEGTDSGGLKWYIGESSTSHADAGMNSTFTGNVKISNGVASGSANIILKPNTTYYLWVFPASQTYGWWWWVGDYATIEVVGSSSNLALSSSSVNVGDTITANIARNSSEFTHTVEFYINNTYYQKFNDVAESQSFTIPDDWCNYMPTSTECKAYCRVTTYNGSAQIGDQISKTFTVKVPTEIIPQIGDILLTPDVVNSNNILVKGKNGLTIKATGCKAGNGSTIKSYTISGPSISKTISSTADTVSAFIASVSNSGVLTYKVAITDARGRSNSDVRTIECYDYYVPSIKNFQAYRAQSDGTADINGEYLKCVHSTEYASVNETNSVTVIFFYSDGTDVLESSKDLIDIGSDLDKTYKVYARVEDAYGGYNISNTETVFGQTRILNITKSGTGIAIGKMADADELFECRWPAKFDDNIDCQEITINQKTIFDLIYPVGSIYISVNSTNPSTIFGGTWEQLKDRFLLGAGSTYSAGNTGGEATHKLTQDELPKITGSIYAGSGNPGTESGGYGAFRTAGGVFSTRNDMQYGRPKEGYESSWPTGDGQYGQAYVDMNFGNNQAHNNMPPYLVVFMWKRVK